MIRLWDADLGHAEELISAVCYSPDGDSLAGGSWNSHVYVWNARDGVERLRLRGHQSRVTTVAFSGTGNQLASGSRDRTVRIWMARSPLEGTSGREAAEPVEARCVVLPGHEAEVAQVAWTTDDAKVVSTSGSFARTWAILYDPPQCLHVIPFEIPALCVAMSPALSAFSTNIWTPGGFADQRKVDRMAIGLMDGNVKICDPDTSNVLAILEGGRGKGAIVSVAWSPDGKRLAAASTDRTICVWLIGGPMDNEMLVQLSRHSKTYGNVAGWEGVTWPEELRWAKISSRIAFFHEPRRPSPHHGRPTAWRYERERGGSPSRQQARNLGEGHPDARTLANDAEIFPPLASSDDADEFPCSLSWDDSGLLLASAWTDSTVRIHDVVEGRLLAALAGHAASVTSVSWNQFDRALASAGSDRCVCVWDVDGVDLPPPRADASEEEDD